MRITEQFSLHYSDFFVIFGRFYKFQTFEPRSEESFYRKAYGILHRGPYKDINLYRSTPSGIGELAAGEATTGLGRGRG